MHANASAQRNSSNAIYKCHLFYIKKLSIRSVVSAMFETSINYMFRYETHKFIHIYAK